MKIFLLGLLTLFSLFFSLVLSAEEVIGTGSMIPAPLMKVWGEAYVLRVPTAAIKYKGSNPADGIKKLINKEVDFSGIDMPMNLGELKKDGLFQYPIALGGVAPVINIPGVYPGQLKLDGNTLARIFLGNITKWNDPVLAELNPTIVLPSADIIIVHRVSPPGISTIIGDYLAKIDPQWKSIKGDGMAGTWPANSIEVKNPNDNVDKIKNTLNSIGYAPIPHIMKNKLSYVQMKNKAGNFVSPSDGNVTTAAENAKWDEINGFEVILTDQPGATSWPLSFASYVLMHKVSTHPERSKEILNFFKYSLRYGGLKAIQYDYIPLPDSVRNIIIASWKGVVDVKGIQIVKN